MSQEETEKRVAELSAIVSQLDPKDRMVLASSKGTSGDLLGALYRHDSDEQVRQAARANSALPLKHILECEDD